MTGWPAAVRVPAHGRSSVPSAGRRHRRTAATRTGSGPARGAHRGANTHPVSEWPGDGRKPGMVVQPVAVLALPASRDAAQQPDRVRVPRAVEGPGGRGPPRPARPRRVRRPGRTSWRSPPGCGLMNSTVVSNSWRSAATRVEHLGLHRSVQRGGRLVKGSGSDGEAASAIAITARCAIPAGQLVRVPPHDPAGIGDLGPCASISSADSIARLGRLPGDLEDLGDLTAHPQGRVQGSPRAPGTPSRWSGPRSWRRALFSHGQRVQPVDADRPGAHPAVTRQIAHQRERRRGLP